MKKLPTLLLLAGIAGSAHAETFVVGPELWDRPRAASRVIQDTAIRQAVAAWLGFPARIDIHHAPGQEALLQAEELRTWLIALAVDAARVRLQGSLREGERLRLEVVRD